MRSTLSQAQQTASDHIIDQIRMSGQGGQGVRVEVEVGVEGSLGVEGCVEGSAGECVVVRVEVGVEVVGVEGGVGEGRAVGFQESQEHVGKGRKGVGRGREGRVGRGRGGGVGSWRSGVLR